MWPASQFCSSCWCSSPPRKTLRWTAGRSRCCRGDTSGEPQADAGASRSVTVIMASPVQPSCISSHLSVLCHVQMCGALISESSYDQVRLLFMCKMLRVWHDP